MTAEQSRAFFEGILRDDCYAFMMLRNPSGRAALVAVFRKYQEVITWVFNTPGFSLVEKEMF